jgi:hypothetical protein
LSRLKTVYFAIDESTDAGGVVLLPVFMLRETKICKQQKNLFNLCPCTTLRLEKIFSTVYEDLWTKIPSIKIDVGSDRRNSGIGGK